MEVVEEEEEEEEADKEVKDKQDIEEGGPEVAGALGEEQVKVGVDVAEPQVEDVDGPRRSVILGHDEGNEGGVCDTAVVEGM